MSKAAMNEYVDVERERVGKSDARRIHQRVHEARSVTHDASVRWPFELLQNAYDTGPRKERRGISVRLEATDGTLVFEHDGAFFSVDDLAALLSGGSNKEIDGKETTGRFGTGFLVTHVLSERTDVSGLLRTSAGAVESFALQLDRAGDEKAILASIRAAHRALEGAVELTSAEVNEAPSARFTYHTDHPEEMRKGLATFREALPYLFATCPGLEKVDVIEDGQPAQTWSAELSIACPHASIDVRRSRRTIRVAFGDGHARILHAHTVFDGTTAEATATFLTENCELGERLVRLPHNFPRLFRRFPLRETSFLPLEAVLDGPFEVKQERENILPADINVPSMEAVLRCVVAAAEIAKDLSITDAHWLARIGAVPAGLGDEVSAWWNSKLTACAEALAKKCLVQTKKGFGAAVPSDAEWCADFISLDAITSNVGHDELWEVMTRVHRLDVPTKAVSKEWSVIARNWEQLGIKVQLRELADLPAFAKGRVQIGIDEDGDPVYESDDTFSALDVDGEPIDWLVDFLECAGRTNAFTVDCLQHVLPNQHGCVRPPGDLKRDAGVRTELKGIAEALGVDVRDELLDTSVVERARQRGHAHVDQLLSKTVPRTVDEDALLERCLSVLEKTIQRKIPADLAAQLIVAGTRLIAFIWNTRGIEDGRTFAVRVPLITRKPDEVYRWSKNKPLMAPVSCWPPTAQPFFPAYPGQRVMHDKYADAPEFEAALEGLRQWEIALVDPLLREKPAELQGARLSALTRPGTVTAELVVRDEEFSYVALLSPEIINHCTEPEYAEALLGLVLNDIAVRDSAWREFRPAKARKGGSLFAPTIDLDLRGALWVADLLSKAWIPTTAEDGKQTRTAANAENLGKYVRSEWLKGNKAALELLASVFSFDRLDLQLLGWTKEDSQRIRDELAQLLDSVDGDLSAVQRLRSDAEAKARQTLLVNAARSFGLAVQDAVKEALKDHGFDVELVDRGYDYAVRLDSFTFEDASTRVGIGGKLLLEIKATRSDEVHMTPTQAATASSSSEPYVLCVVKLKGTSDERLLERWTAADVVPSMRFVTSIGSAIQPTWTHVSSALQQDVPIRNEAALRFAVSEEMWSSGLELDAWAEWAVAILSGKEAA